MATERSRSATPTNQTRRLDENTRKNTAKYSFRVSHTPPLSIQHYLRSSSGVPVGAKQWQPSGKHRPPIFRAYLSPAVRQEKKIVEPVWHPPGAYREKRPTSLSPERIIPKHITEPVWHPAGKIEHKPVPYFDPPSLRWPLQELLRSTPEMRPKTFPYNGLFEGEGVRVMIDSLMPPKYAKVIMEDFDVFRERVQNVNLSRQGEDDLQMTVYRPLHIERMENVSILFADIVGFTHISLNKTASQLVSLLSDLYGRFDELCVQMSCEKIATLGDCYYCVSGCPEPREDHARACVLIGLAMINAIEELLMKMIMTKFI